MVCNDRHLLITDFFKKRKLSALFFFFFFLKWRHQNDSSLMDGFMQIDSFKNKFSVPLWNFKVVPS